MKNILITGIRGFVGSNLAGYLTGERYSVTGIARDSKQTSSLKLLGLEDEVNIVLGDCTNQRLVERVISDYGIDAIFHLAANTIVAHSQRAPAVTISNNVLGVLSVLEAARVCGKIEAIIVQTTDKVYGDQPSPLTEDLPLLADEPYSVSKAACDIIAKMYFSTYNLPIIITRPANLYGPGDICPRVIPNTIRTCLKGESPVAFRKDDKREFLFISDVIKAYMVLLKNVNEYKGQAFNIGTDDIKNNEEVVLEILKSYPELQLHYADPDTDIKEIPMQWPDCTKINKLGWRPKVSFEEGIKATIKWWKSL